MYFLWLWLVKVRVRWVRPKVLCGRCLIRVASMHAIKSIRMFERTVFFLLCVGVGVWVRVGVRVRVRG